MTHPYADVPAELRRLVAGTVRATDAEEPSDVLDAALGAFFDDHDPLREAAVAERYATSGFMTTGRASDLAGVTKGPEIESLLRDHGVVPLVGPMSDETADRVRAENRALYADDASMADVSAEPSPSDDDASNDDSADDEDPTDGDPADEPSGPFAAVGRDAFVLTRGAAAVDAGLGDETGVITVALRWFYREHPELREAAREAAPPLDDLGRDPDATGRGLPE